MSDDPVLNAFSSLTLSDGELEYLRGQSRRIEYLAQLVQRYCDKLERSANILDVGPHFLTRYIMDTINPRPSMSTLGYPYSRLVPRDLLVEQVTTNLNECANSPPIFTDQKFDVILFCEVVEHLFIPPDVILSFLRNFLRPDGGVIILGTPNAVCLSNRLRMMTGENPFHSLSRDWKSGAGHIREYTMQELRQYGKVANLDVEFEEYCDYWKQWMYINNITELEREVPSYRTGLTIVYRIGATTEP